MVYMVGCAWIGHAQPTDSISADSVPVELREVEVKAVGPRRLLRHSHDGRTEINAAMLGELPSFMGGNDPIAIVRSLPAVAANNELQAALNVRGGASGANLYLTDGVRIANPMHMLGLYSTYNPSYYQKYDFRPGHISATYYNTSGAVLESHSNASPVTEPGGEVSLGLIESHGALRLPVGARTSVSVGLRRSYLGLLFPDILKLGKSTISYHFTDINAGIVSDIADGHTLSLNFFGNKDAMALKSDNNGSKDGDFGWSNVAASAAWQGRRFAVALQYTGFNNNFVMAEGARTLDLPSSLRQITARGSAAFGHFDAESDISCRHTSGQHNRAENTSGSPAQTGYEWNVAGSYSCSWMHRLNLEAGLRVSVYFMDGWTYVVPQPRVRLSWRFVDDFRIYLSYNRLVRFDRLVEETTAGLPADFWMQATEAFRPEDVHMVEIGTSGYVSPLGISYVLEAYYRRMLHQGEYAGSLLDLTNANYNPLDDLLDGRGYAVGLSVSLMRQFGKVRGRAGYNLGRSRLKFDRYGAHYFPSSHDRLHDLSASLTWQPIAPLTLGAVFTHATGLPYTKAKYGYMIGENLICEYYPHNSSRLPAYNRLDLSASWKITRRKLSHIFSLSVYNALANRNVLFCYTSYSIRDGIERRESVMKSVIPSLNYSLSF